MICIGGRSLMDRKEAMGGQSVKPSLERVIKSKMGNRINALMCTSIRGKQHRQRRPFVSGSMKGSS